MNWALIRTVIILPGNALVFIPAIIVWMSRDTTYAASLPDLGQLLFWCALAIFCMGMAMAVWTVRLFLTFGEGTPAPWNPPQRLVVRGPYRYVRNPMISSVLAMLLAEALMFQSLPLAAWMAIFFGLNAVYFPLVEEKGLEKRFGDDYREYKAHVPRWIPRLRPWNPGGPNQE
ncbi:MAG: methyltransferase family protein [Mariprofundaceae bacterium]